MQQLELVLCSGPGLPYVAVLNGCAAFLVFRCLVRHLVAYSPGSASRASLFVACVVLLAGPLFATGYSLDSVTVPTVLYSGGFRSLFQLFGRHRMACRLGPSPVVLFHGALCLLRKPMAWSVWCPRSA